MWGDIWGFTVTEYVWSRDSGIFRRWWVKVVSPYIHHDKGCDDAIPAVQWERVEHNAKTDREDAEHLSV